MSVSAETPGSIGGRATPSGAIVAKAVVNGEIYYGTDGALCRAPRGEYDIAHKDGRVRFSSRAGRDAFTISLNAFVQHLHEGRLALVARRRAA
jgi:hypothetical protein